MSNTVETAKVIRQLLKKSFPNFKFSVKSHIYSMGSSIHISWQDGPSEDSVEEVAKSFQEVRYDDYSGEILSGGNMFVFCKQEVSEEFKQQILNNYFVKRQEKENGLWSNEHHDMYFKARTAYSQLWEVENGLRKEISDQLNWIIAKETATKSEEIHTETAEIPSILEEIAQPATTTQTTHKNRDFGPEMGALEVLEGVLEVSETEEFIPTYKAPAQASAIVTYNEALNGIEIKFTRKPDSDVLQMLKGAGYRWHGMKKLWYARQNEKTKAVVSGL
jgi:hypothetical protein